jgi:transposase-like protein
MYRILSANPTLPQHIAQIQHAPDVYRPAACPHCGLACPWQHGYYLRKADRCEQLGATLNPVSIARFYCQGCERTCSRLPLCIAPRRWYDWAQQQRVLQQLLSGSSQHHVSERSGLDRHTVRRWWRWLKSRTTTFSFFLRSRFPHWGRTGDFESFWETCLNQMPLSEAMAWLDQELTVP